MDADEPEQQPPQPQVDLKRCSYIEVRSCLFVNWSTFQLMNKEKVSRCSHWYEHVHARATVRRLSNMTAADLFMINPSYLSQLKQVCPLPLPLPH